MVVTNVVLPAGLNQGKGPFNVGFDEWCWVDQRVVIVALGSVVDHCVGLANQLVNQFLITNVTNNQPNLVLRQAGDVSRVTGIGQLVQNSDVFNLRVVINQEVNEVRTNEATATGDDNVLKCFFHIVIFPKISP